MKGGRGDYSLSSNNKMKQKWLQKKYIVIDYSMQIVYYWYDFSDILCLHILQAIPKRFRQITFWHGSHLILVTLFSQFETDFLFLNVKVNLENYEFSFQYYCYHSCICIWNLIPNWNWMGYRGNHSRNPGSIEKSTYSYRQSNNPI